MSYLVAYNSHDRAREAALATKDWLSMLRDKTQDENKLLEQLIEFLEVSNVRKPICSESEPERSYRSSKEGNG